MFPVDDSTNFLEPVRIALEKELDATIIRGNTTKEEHRKEIMAQLRELREQDVFVFMGHGASYCLYGSPQGGELQPLLGRGALSLPKRSGSLLISCRSSEFIQHEQLINAVGFGGIAATWEEMLKLRDEDLNCYPGVDENTILVYQNSFVQALCKALQLWDSSSQSLRQLYQNIRLCITGQIVRLYLDQILAQEQKQGLFEMLYELKQGVGFL